MKFCCLLAAAMAVAAAEAVVQVHRYCNIAITQQMFTDMCRAEQQEPFTDIYAAERQQVNLLLIQLHFLNSIIYIFIYNKNSMISYKHNIHMAL